MSLVGKSSNVRTALGQLSGGETIELKRLTSNSLSPAMRRRKSPRTAAIPVQAGQAGLIGVYSAAGLSPGQIARDIFFIATAFGNGLSTIATFELISRADEVSGLLGSRPEPLRSAAAVILTLAT